MDIDRLALQYSLQYNDKLDININKLFQEKVYATATWWFGSFVVLASPI